MSRRDAGAAGQQARHARARLQATLGEAPPGLLQEGAGVGGFEFRGAGETDGTGTGSGTGGGPGGSSGAPSFRWRVGLRVALLLGALAVAAGAWFWWQAGAAAPEVLPLSGVGSGGTAAPGGPGADGTPPPGPGHGQEEPTAGGLVVVHVAGAVAAPGVIRLQHGSRVDDAIAAAGGAAPDADVNRLNLALVVEDGQKIYVPQRGEQVSSAPDAPGSGGTGPGGTVVNGDGSKGPGPNVTGQAHGTGGGKINLNSADAAEPGYAAKSRPGAGAADR
ncbi:SLBB domain-containing protein [Pseudarthrobacter sp. Fe7]|nr:SLBB domain-containing protein [Pseudarthrobacter sp. Fe7]